MKEAVVVDAVRTPLGKSSLTNVMYRDVRSDELGVAVVKALINRNLFDVKEIEDVFFGCALQNEEQGYNIARQIVLESGLPVEIPAATVNRLCGSSLQAVAQAAQAIMVGYGDIFIAGGVEHMAHIPMDKGVDFNPKLFKYFSKAIINMGVTCEFLAMTYGISRQEQDQFALHSHEKASKATQEGRFQTEIVPILGRNDKGLQVLMEQDQGIRPDSSLESLSKLDPVFNPKGGTITAGNASQVSDGASALLIMSSDRAKELGLKAIAKIRSFASVGVDPALFGLGPVPATIKALKRANLSISDIDVIELNEAFAVQSLAVIRDLKLDESKVNLNGGAIAMGHPLGCSGARISTTLLHTMKRSGHTLGLATMCIGLGQGIAMVFEKV